LPDFCFWPIPSIELVGRERREVFRRCANGSLLQEDASASSTFQPGIDELALRSSDAPRNFQQPQINSLAQSGTSRLSPEEEIPMRIARMLVAIAALAASAPSSAAVITFDDLPGSNGTPIAPYYQEDEFWLIPHSGGDQWLKSTYGKPGPSAIFNRERGEPEQWAGMHVFPFDTDPFQFRSIDLYSSVTPIPYRFLGYFDGILMFDISGTMGNSFGQFATLTNPLAETWLHVLYVELVNPYVAFGGNPVGFDNLVLNREFASVPEPGVWAALATALAILVYFQRSRVARSGRRS
jgi:hypothetical protein